MKSDVSVLDLEFLIRELQEIIGSKISKIYQENEQSFALLLWKKTLEQNILRIQLPCYVWLDSTRDVTGESPSNFCMFLRKRLELTTITALELVPGERIVKITCEGASVRYLIYIELFSNGNFVLCRSDGVIEGALIKRSWASREIKVGIPYQLPGRPPPLPGVMNASKYLATLTGVGKRWALEICSRACVDPSADVTESLQLQLLGAKDALQSTPLVPAVVRSAPPFVEPFTFQSVVASRDSTATLSAAYKLIASLPEPEGTRVLSTQEESASDKWEKAIAMQQDATEKHLRRSKELEAVGQAIYEQYADVASLYTAAKSLREQKHGLKEMLGKQAGIWTVVAVDEKTKSITLDTKEL